MIRSARRASCRPPPKAEIGRRALGSLLAARHTAQLWPVIFAQDLYRPLEYRRRQEQVHEMRIELRRATAHQLFRGFAGAPRRAVAAAERHGVERIGDRDDPRGKWNRGAAKTAWIAATVPSLVVREHAFRQVR